METPTQITIPASELEAFCDRWKIRKLAFFGSVLRDDYHPASDLDVLVEFDADAHWGVLDHIQMKQELEALVGRTVDLITQRGLDATSNWLFRQEVMNTARIVFEKPETRYAPG